MALDIKPIRLNSVKIFTGLAESKTKELDLPPKKDDSFLCADHLGE